MVRRSINAGKKAAKLLAWVGILCILASMLSVAAFAAGGAQIKVVTAPGERGATADIAVVLENNPGIWGIKLRIQYDQSVMALQAVTAGSVFTQGELTMSEDLGKHPFVILASGSQLKNITANGTVFTLRFLIKDGTKYGDYPVSVEVVQTNNVDGQEVAVSVENGAVSVVNCVHGSQQWKTIVAAKCLSEGEELLICNKCGGTFGTRKVAATGHLHTEIKNAKDPTATAPGYTGDTYCKDCGMLVAKGESIPALPTEPTETTQPTEPSEPSEPSAPTVPTQPPVPEIIQGQNAVFEKGSGTDLVFVSNADIQSFLRAEIDGQKLPEGSYTTSGSTVLTVKADYLETLRGGSHTVAIVSRGGSAITAFTVNGENVSQRQPISSTLLIVLCILVLVEAAALVVLFVWKRGRTA